MLWRRLESKPIQHVEILNVQSGAHLKNSGAMGRQKESMKNSKLDWKGVGQLVAVLVQVWTIIRQVVVREKIGLEILDWIVGEGEKSFKTFLYALVETYQNSLPQKPKTEYIIDSDAIPNIPSGLRLADDGDQIVSRVKGKRNLSDIKVSLHLDVGQTDGKLVKGYDLKSRLEGQAVLGAQFLDFYLEHPALIPEDWKKKGWIFFWGTIYRDVSGHLCVRYLNWRGARWVSPFNWLGRDWNYRHPAAVSASPLV